MKDKAMKQFIFLSTTIIFIIFCNGCDVRESPHISITGHAQLMVPVDCAEINIYVIIEGDSPQAVEKEGSEIAKRASEKLEEYGIGAKEILTSSVTIGKDRFSDSKKFQFTLKYTVIFNELAFVGQLRKDLLAAGVTNFSVEEYSNTKLGELKNELSALAIDNAKQRAAAMVEKSAQSIGKIISLSEDSYNSRSPLLPVRKPRSFRGLAMSSKSPTTADVVIIPENIKIEKSINVDFELH